MLLLMMMAVQSTALVGMLEPMPRFAFQKSARQSDPTNQ
jgi:hypothetical protein